MVGFVQNKTDINHPCDIYDYPLPFTDSFVDFDPIKEWLEEDPPIPPPPYSMDDFDKLNEEFCEKGRAAHACYVNDEAENVQSLGLPDQQKDNQSVKLGSLVDLVQESGDIGDVIRCMEKGNEGFKLESLVDSVHESGDIGAVIKCIEKGHEEIVDKIEFNEGKLGEVGSSIQEELKRVCLNRDYVVAGEDLSKIKNDGMIDGEENVAKKDSNYHYHGVKQNVEVLTVNDDRVVKKEVVSDRDESESESESECESSGSSSSSSASSSDTSSDEDDDEEEEGPNRKSDITGLEEGEIMTSEADGMVAWSDEEDDEVAMKGPIRSKNEITDLPPVPAVNVTLLPHHHTLPVGIISSVLGSQVIVDGVERHNPLSEGSILWITESRSPLGLVDEIFGPVKNPYYIVRYNSESEVPAGLQEGTRVSFVPEFADHVLNNANLYRKGYDASNENDEELSDEMEFSDDEKEAEYKRMQKMKKRVTSDDKGKNRKKDKRNSKNQFVGKCEQSPTKQAHDFANNQSTQHYVQPPGVSSGTNPVFSSGLMPGHPLPQPGVAPVSNNSTISSNAWFNENLSQQTAGTRFPINLQMQGMPWLQGNHPHQILQAPFLNVAPFQQNIHMNPSLHSNLSAAVGQANFAPGLSFAPWPGGVSPNFLNQSLFGMGMQGQNAPALSNLGANDVSSSGLQHGSLGPNFLNQSILGMGMQGQNASTSTNVGLNGVPSNGFQTMATSNTGNDSLQNFNPGTHRGGGRRPYHRVGGRFGGGRGRRPC